MPDSKQALTDLLAKVEAGGDVYGFGAVGTPLYRGYAESAYNGSLDAAKALHEAVLPGWVVNGLDQASNLAGDPWGCEVAYFDGSSPNNNRKSYSGHDHTNPARAWLIAILKALIARQEYQQADAMLAERNKGGA